jgi:hypothetical protein
MRARTAPRATSSGSKAVASGGWMGSIAGRQASTAKATMPTAMRKTSPSRMRLAKGISATLSARDEAWQGTSAAILCESNETPGMRRRFPRHCHVKPARGAISIAAKRLGVTAERVEQGRWYRLPAA